MSQYKAVIDLIRKEQVSLFLGAGFSLKAGAPSCRLLTEQILNDIEEDERRWYANHPLDVLAKEYIDYNDGNRAKLIELLKPLFDFSILDFSDHQSLAVIPHFRRIFTTNYDCLLEKAYGDSCIVVKRNEDVHNVNAARVTIFKIHGDFDYPDDLLITKDDYFDFYRSQRNELIWDVVKAEFATHPILFIGYSLEDDNIYTLIRRVREQSKGATNPIFLIAPGMTTQKRKRLERIGVQYFDAKAEDFFKDLFLELDKNIVHDAQRKRVSEDTFHIYCRHRNLEVELRSTSNKNSVGNIRALNGGKHSIKFRTSNELAGKLFSDEREYNDILMFHGVPIPSLKITSEEMQFFDYTVNGVLFSDKSDIANVFVAPVHEEINCQIKIPSRRFRENVKLVKYSSKGYEATFVLNTDSYLLKMTFDFQKSNNLNVNMQVDFKKKYTDNTQALHWMILLQAIWRGEHVTFSRLYKGGSPFTLETPKNSLEETDFDKRIAYYENVNELEDLIGTPFSSYEEYTPDNYEKTMILLSYLKNAVYIKPMPKDAILSFEMIPNDERAQDLQVGCMKYCFGITSESSDELSFNGYSTKIPFQHELYRDSEVVERTLLPNGNIAMKIKFSAGSIYKWYSDEPGMDRKEGYETIRIQKEPGGLPLSSEKGESVPTSDK